MRIINNMISVVVPCYNSEKTIKLLIEETRKILKETNYSYEFILVNDHSKDNTFSCIEELAQNYNNIVAIDLAKNFGQHNAIMAALSYVRGEFVVAMDDDMQTHPSQLMKLMKKLSEGYDLVYGKYKKKKESVFRRIVSSVNNYTLGKMINQPKNITTSSYWVARRFLVEEIKKYPHSFSNIRGLFFRSTSNVADVEIEHFDRLYGKSNYSIVSLLKLWSSCINFSVLPLRIALILGGIVAFFSFISIIFLVIRNIIGIATLAGWASTISVICFFSGIILMCLGIIGEYIGRIFMCINKTPQFVIRELIDRRDE